MSQLEVAQNSPVVYSTTFILAAGGTVINAAAIPNFNGASSKIIGCRRVSSNGGLEGQPYVQYQNTGGSAFPILRVASDTLGDVSTYQVFWTNQVAYSNNQTIIPC